MTNYEKFKGMSVEEMASFIVNTPNINFCAFCFYNGEICTDIRCADGVKLWLESEATVKE
ncbi:MAG: hypothetical protein ACI4XP_09700 [Acutalibacteraceae bacterium]